MEAGRCQLSRSNNNNRSDDDPEFDYFSCSDKDDDHMNGGGASSQQRAEPWLLAARREARSLTMKRENNNNYNNNINYNNYNCQQSSSDNKYYNNNNIGCVLQQQQHQQQQHQQQQHQQHKQLKKFSTAQPSCSITSPRLPHVSMFKSSIAQQLNSTSQLNSISPRLSQVSFYSVEDDATARVSLDDALRFAASVAKSRNSPFRPAPNWNSGTSAANSIFGQRSPLPEQQRHINPSTTSIPRFFPAAASIQSHSTRRQTPQFIRSRTAMANPAAASVTSSRFRDSRIAQSEQKLVDTRATVEHRGGHINGHASHTVEHRYGYSNGHPSRTVEHRGGHTNGYASPSVKHRGVYTGGHASHKTRISYGRPRTSPSVTKQNPRIKSPRLILRASQAKNLSQAAVRPSAESLSSSSLSIEDITGTSTPRDTNPPVGFRIPVSLESAIRMLSTSSRLTEKEKERHNENEKENQKERQKENQKESQKKRQRERQKENQKASREESLKDNQKEGEQASEADVQLPGNTEDPKAAAVDPLLSSLEGEATRQQKWLCIKTPMNKQRCCTERIEGKKEEQMRSEKKEEQTRSEKREEQIRSEKKEEQIRSEKKEEQMRSEKKEEQIRSQEEQFNQKPTCCITIDDSPDETKKTTTKAAAKKIQPKRNSKKETVVAKNKEIKAKDPLNKANDSWSQQETEALRDAMNQNNIGNGNYWNLVAQSLRLRLNSLRTARECARKAVQLEEEKMAAHLKQAPAAAAADCTTMTLGDVKNKVPTKGNTRAWRMHQLMQKMASQEKSEDLLQGAVGTPAVHYILAGRNEAPPESSQAGWPEAFHQTAGRPLSDSDVSKRVHQTGYVPTSFHQTCDATPPLTHEATTAMPLCRQKHQQQLSGVTQQPPISNTSSNIQLNSNSNSIQLDNSNSNRIQLDSNNSSSNNVQLGNSSSRPSIPTWVLTPNQLRLLSDVHTGLTPPRGAGDDAAEAKTKVKKPVVGTIGTRNKGVMGFRGGEGCCTSSSAYAENGYVFDDDESEYDDESDDDNDDDDQSYASRFAADVLGHAAVNRTLQHQRFIDGHKKRYQKMRNQPKRGFKVGKARKTGTETTGRSRFDVVDIQRELTSALGEKEVKKMKEERLDVVESLKWTKENAELEDERLEATDELNWVAEDDDEDDDDKMMMDDD